MKRKRRRERYAVRDDAERMMGVDLRCGGGRVAALERPRRSIHSRSRSTPTSKKNSPILRMKLLFLERMMGVNLRCGGGRVGLQHATGMLPRALAFDSHRSKEEGPPSRAIPLLLERMMGVEPTLPAWEAEVLPMNYIRV